MNEYEERRKRLDGNLDAIMGAVPGLSEFDTDNIRALMRGDEYHLAVELLCSQLYEYDLPLTAAVFHELEEIALETRNSDGIALLRSNVQE